MSDVTATADVVPMKCRSRRYSFGENRFSWPNFTAAEAFLRKKLGLNFNSGF